MKNKTHLAFLGFRGGPGGISNVMLNLINSSCQFGLKVDLLINNPDIPELRSVDPRVRCVHLGRSTGLKGSLSLARYIDKSRPRVILTNRERANRAVASALLVSSHRPKLVFRCGMPISVALKRRGIVKRALRRWSIVLSYKRADLVVANSQKVAQDLEQEAHIPLDKIRVLHNPTVSREIQRLAHAPPPHRWLGQSVPVVLGIGRLARQKGFHTLIRAFHLLTKEMDARLIILGEGKERAALERLCGQLGIAHLVEMPGFTPNPFSYLGRASLFVLSSQWEGSPNVLIEALALGTPVVSTDCPTGPREILQGGRYGPLVGVGNAEEMAHAMKRVLDAPLPPETLKEAARPYDAMTATREYLLAMGFPVDG